MSVGLVTPSQRTGRPVSLSADGKPEWMDIGVSIAWELIAAATAQTELADGTIVYPGEKYIRYGTVMVPVTTADTSEVQTVDLSGADDPTGGTWTLNILGETTAALAYNASAAVVQAAIRALDDDPDSTLANVTVGKAGFVYTITFPADAGNVDAVTVGSGSLTSGGTVTVTIATTTQGVNSSGKYAPFDSTKTNGQQTLARDAVGILNQTKKDSELTVFGAHPQNDLTGLIIGGLVWPSRLLVGGSGQPTLANLKTVLPLLKMAKE